MKRSIVGLALGTLAAVSATPATAAIALQSGVEYTENFDSLAITGTSSAVPAGWFFSESGTNANTSYIADSGASNAGNTYSYGSSGSTERAFGALGSGSLTSTIGASFTVDSAITSFTVRYVGEQWRRGAASNSALFFAYSLDGFGWTNAAVLDFASPQCGDANTATVGNSATCRTAVQGTVSNLSIHANDTFWIRWTNANAIDTDDGLAIDDFGILVQRDTSTPPEPVPEPSTYALMIAGLGLLGFMARRRKQ